jgi:chemotaxis protein CheZ
MKMDSAAELAPTNVTSALPAAAQPTAANAIVYKQIGILTRALHDTLSELGVMPKLQIATDGLPDARSRLTYIAQKTADAANKVLNSVDQAKADHAYISQATRDIAARIVADPVKAVASGAVMNFVEDVERRTASIDQHLTDIMLAQDFHDLTGQVAAKVSKLATDLEDSLLKLLVSIVPEEEREKVDPTILNGPVVSAEGRADVVTNQGEVDDLLASLGF